ncbi:MAG TPA: PIN domain-containing protein [Vicinamibacteria bacterium]|nr:PIN domain-containing protein [Vicinamibacteria bacterium]
MRFWDSSALVPLVVRQRASSPMRSLYRSDSGVIAWWGARVECESAIARLAREGHLRRRAAAAARGRLDRFADTWQEVQPVESVREWARRLLRVHDLRAADALQLAAAMAAAEGRPPTLPFACLDERLSAAAEREGFPVLGVAPDR